MFSFFLTAVFAISFLLGTIYKGPELPAEWEQQRRQHEADLKLWDTERQRWELEVSQHAVQRDQWAREREEFEKERTEIVREKTLLKQDIAALNRDRNQLEREKDKMTRARADHELEKLGWAIDRATWARDRDDWERERSEREPVPHDYPAEAHWDIAVPSERCHSYGKREYSARLWDIPSGWDWMEACKFTPIDIHGIVVHEADRCDDNGWWGGVVGHWIIDDGAAICKPRFDTKQDQVSIQGQLEHKN